MQAGWHHGGLGTHGIVRTLGVRAPGMNPWSTQAGKDETHGIFMFFLGGTPGLIDFDVFPFFLSLI